MRANANQSKSEKNNKLLLLLINTKNHKAVNSFIDLDLKIVAGNDRPIAQNG